MDQLPIFLNVNGRTVILVGNGDAADAKRRLIERAGATCVDAGNPEARIAFVAIDDEAEALAAASDLKARGLLVNVVDRPDHCDFTTPAIVDRSPVIVAVGTGGASAGMAKAIRQRFETMLPATLGLLADRVAHARDAIRVRWPGSADRRRALDAAFSARGPLDPFADASSDAVEGWIGSAEDPAATRLIEIQLLSNLADDLTLLTARLLGEADQVFHDPEISLDILGRARADALRLAGAPPATPPEGLSLYLRLPLPSA